MASIKIMRFGGLLPQVNPKALPNDRAQIAHNCLLWDGFLRPMPQWQIDQTVGSTPQSLFKYPAAINGYKYDLFLRQALQNLSEPFDNNLPIGIGTAINSTGVLTTYISSGGPRCFVGVPQPSALGLTQVITNNNFSVYPISRTYAITYVSGKQEGAPTILPQIGTNGTLFEGDSVQITFTLDPLTINQYNITGVRLYRTIPGFDTSEQLGNPLETGFHLAGSFNFFPTSPPPTAIFVDGVDGSQLQGDLLISDEWMPPPPPSLSNPNDSLFFGQTESGWGVHAHYNGAIGFPPNAVDFSERYMYHAWPPQNRVLLPDLISGIATYYDDVFVGTKSVPYYLHVGVGEAEALNISVKPFKDEYACVSGTMVGTNFGAIYASKDGLIALSAESENVTSKRIASPGDPLNTGTFTYHFYDAVRAGWWNGNYFGFTPNGGYIFNQPNPSNNEYPLGQLVTIDLPNPVPGPSVATGSGFFTAFGNSIYKFALPGYGYDSAPKATYTWKSKRYVMPGLTTFAAAKCVNDGSGSLNVTINGYNSGQETTPSFVYTRPLSHSNPFRIPHQFKCLEFDFVLSGTSAVEEFHIATSERELTETPGSE